jgi:hypothetical protein
VIGARSRSARKNYAQRFRILQRFRVRLAIAALLAVPPPT